MLRFSPTAWAKLMFLRDSSDTEVGGFGITSAGDLLRVEDFQLVGQIASYAHVAFDDKSVADFFDRQIDAGRQPAEFARIWIHTHPGNCPRPSGTDEETFARVFGRSDWSLMFILARAGESYARLRFNYGPAADLEIPVRVDYERPFAGSDVDGWTREYLENVKEEDPLKDTLTAACSKSIADELKDPEDQELWRDYWSDWPLVPHDAEEGWPL